MRFVATKNADHLDREASRGRDCLTLMDVLKIRKLVREPDLLGVNSRS